MEDASGVLKERLARGSEVGAPLAHVEELGAVVAFERADVGADRRLREVENACGAGEAALPGHRKEGLEIVEGRRCALGRWAHGLDGTLGPGFAYVAVR